MGNPFCWVELTTHNVDGAREFYSKLFDWQVNPFDMPGGTYQVIDTGSEPGGGIVGLPEPGIQTGWTQYIQVDDIQDSCAKVSELGGKVWKGPFEVPEVGRLAIVCDPQGAFFGLWQKKS